MIVAASLQVKSDPLLKKSTLMLLIERTLSSRVAKDFDITDYEKDFVSFRNGINHPQSSGALSGPDWHLELHVDAADLGRIQGFVRESPVEVVIEWQMPQKRISICTSCSVGWRRRIVLEASSDVALAAE